MHGYIFQCHWLTPLECSAVRIGSAVDCSELIASRRESVVESLRGPYKTRCCLVLVLMQENLSFPTLLWLLTNLYLYSNKLVCITAISYKPDRQQQRVGIIVVPVLSSPGPSASNLPASSSVLEPDLTLAKLEMTFSCYVLVICYNFDMAGEPPRRNNACAWMVWSLEL